MAITRNHFYIMGFLTCNLCMIIATLDHFIELFVRDKNNYCDVYAVIYFILAASGIYGVATVCGGGFGFMKKFSYVNVCCWVKGVAFSALVFLVCYYASTTWFGNETPRRVWEDRVGKNWPSVSECLYRNQICTKSQNQHITNACCNAPPACNAVKNRTLGVSECISWQPNGYLCFECMKCKDAVFDEFIKDWNQKKPELILLLVCMGVLFVLEVLFYMGYQRFIRQQQQQQIELQPQP